MTDEKALPAPGDEPTKKPAKKTAAKKKAAPKMKAEPAASENEPAKKPAAKKKAAPKKKAAAAVVAEAEEPATEAAPKKKAAPRKKAAAKTKAPGKGKKRPSADDGEPDEPISEGEAGSGTGPALVIVESPAKAKTINKYLGKNYVVLASYGHVRDLPSSGMGISIENNFLPDYEPLEGKKKVINDLKKTAKNASAIYLACDNDREGEAIAWHISELLKARKDPCTFRVTFNEITKSAIEKAFETPRQVNMAKVNAQQARRVLDRIVGYKLSPILWKKLGKRNLSAGRVQSVAVKLVVERERAIKAFNPIEYWDLEATLAKLDAPPPPPPPPEPTAEETAEAASADAAAESDGPAPKASEAGKETAAEKVAAARTLGPGRFFAKLVAIDEERLDPDKRHVKDEAEATGLREELKTSRFVVASVKKSERKENPSPPFITSSLQQQASTRLRFATNKTMRVAQGLYEGVELGEEGSVGLITYMRTDSFNLAKEAVDEAREFIQTTYGAQYLPDEPKVYRRDEKAGAQEAHEAIRPTSALRTPEKLAPFLNAEQLKLYQLIWERFVSGQMPPAVFAQTSVEVKAGRATFRASGRTLIFDGFQRVAGVGKKDEAILPEVAENEVLNCEKLQASQHFTQGPARYTEASLVKELEELGIGRPSTYATIVSTIQDRGYAEQENRRFRATKLGMIVTDKLQGYFQNVMDTDFTKSMELRLDKIEEEKIDWTKVLSDFYGPFEKEVENATEKMKGINEEPEESTIACKKCGRLMVYKYNTRGDFSRFLGCPGYNTEDKCTETLPVDEAGEPQVPEETDETCPECGSSMVIRTGRRGRFLACSAYPNCKVTRELADEGTGQLMPDLEAACEKCQKKMVVRRGARGPFLGCTGYPECKSTLPIVKNAEGKWVVGEKRDAAAGMPEMNIDCEKCGAPMKIRMSRRGPFLGCTAYPKCRGTAQVPESVKAAMPKKEPPVPLGENCELCGKPLMIRQGRRGPFAGCSGYPKCRNTRQLPGGG